MRVTKMYNISGNIPFVDVHLEKDNILFLDPSAIRNGKDARSQYAHRTLVRFFEEVLKLRLSIDENDFRRGKELLSHLHEPNETRLGMGCSKVAGRAFGSDTSDILWSTLGESREARLAVLTRLEDLRLFVDNVGPDLISDAATRVIFGLLADFTIEMVQRYPAMESDTVQVKIEYFDISKMLWMTRVVNLPAPNGKVLILVPKEWVYTRSIMDVAPFYNRFSTETLQEEQTTQNSDGKLAKPTKKKLKAQNRDMRKLNRDQASKYKEEYDRNLVSEYRKFVDQNFVPLTDEKIIERIEKVSNSNLTRK